MITGHLDDDPTILKSCSLVSKLWLRSTHHRLFHQLALPISLNDPSLQVFCELISSPFSTFVPAPACLALHLDDSLTVGSGQVDEIYWTSIDWALTKILASACPNKLSLSFDPQKWVMRQNMTSRYMTLLYRRLEVSTITTLELQHFAVFAS